MKTQVAATVVDGMLKPDESLQLAEQTRVNLTIELLGEESEPEVDPTYDSQKAMAAWNELKAFRKKHPIHGGGKRFTRDELHERR